MRVVMLPVNMPLLIQFTHRITSMLRVFVTGIGALGLPCLSHKSSYHLQFPRHNSQAMRAPMNINFRGVFRLKNNWNAQEFLEVAFHMMAAINARKNVQWSLRIIYKPVSSDRSDHTFFFCRNIVLTVLAEYSYFSEYFMVNIVSCGHS